MLRLQLAMACDVFFGRILRLGTTILSASINENEVPHRRNGENGGPNGGNHENVGGNQENQ